MIAHHAIAVDSGDPIRGHIVIAAEDLASGTLVLDEQPLAFCLNPVYWKARCGFCFKRTRELKQCTRCKSQWFCGQACFRKAWKCFHRNECNVLRDGALEQAGISDVAGQCDALLLSRVFAELQRNKLKTRLNPAAKESLKDSFETLAVPPSLPRSDDNIYRLASQLCTLAKASTSSLLAETVEEEEVANALYQFRCNNFGIMDVLLTTIGAGVYPAAAKLNHSCQPNCCLSYHEGTRLKIHTTCRIAKGEELFHAYIDIAETKAFRQQKLLDTYGFHCTCALCQQPRLVEPMQGGKAGVLIDLDRAFHSMKGGRDLAPEQQKKLETVGRLQLSVATFDDPVQELSVLTKVFDVKHRYLEPLNLEILALRSQIVQLSMLTENWQLAAIHCDAICQAYRRIYGETHPLLGLQLLTLGDIKLNKIGHATKGTSLLKRAHKVLTIACGSEAEIVGIVSSMLNES